MKGIVHFPTLIITLILVFLIGWLISLFVDIQPVYASLIILGGVLLNGILIVFDKSESDEDHTVDKKENSVKKKNRKPGAEQKSNS